MLRNRFNELLAERNLRITKVSNDTKISRTTLTAISQENSKGIQLDTLNTLCNYLKITPCDFFDYLPFDISYNLEDSTADGNKPKHVYNEIGQIVTIKEYTLFINILDSNGSFKNTFEIIYILSITDDSVIDVDYSIHGETTDIRGTSVKIYIKEDQDNDDFIEFLDFYKSLSVVWRTKIQTDILLYINKCVSDEYKEKYKNKNYQYAITYLESNFNKFI